MRIAILAAGTRGDVQPVLAVGAELKRRGHSVVVAVNSDLAGWVEQGGLEAVPTGLNVGRFLDSQRARQFLASGRAAAALREIAADERRASEPINRACLQASQGADLILSTLMMGYRGLCLGDATGVSSLTLFCFPFQATGDWASILTGVRDFRLSRVNRVSSAAFHRLLWARSRPAVDDMCDLLGVPRYRRRPCLEARPSVHVYSGRLAPRPADWGPQHQVAGWTTLSPEQRRALGEDSLPAGLSAWLDDGSPPVYFGFGSMPVLDPAGLLRDVARITGRLGVRGLIGAGWSDFCAATDVPGHLFLARSEFDHDRVLPGCRAAVHHGGSGTTGAVLRAGIPSVVASVFADQPYWGWRVEQAGVGATVPFRKLTPARLASALDRVLSDAYGQRAHVLGAAVRAENGTRQAANIIERLSAAPARPSAEPAAEPMATEGRSHA